MTLADRRPAHALPAPWPAEFPADTIAARHLRAAYAGHACCLRCGMPWVVASPQYVQYAAGCDHQPAAEAAAICQPCWMLCSPRERLAYYDALVSVWQAHNPHLDYQRVHIMMADAVIDATALEDLAPAQAGPTPA